MSFKCLFIYCIPVVWLTHYQIYFCQTQEEKKTILLCTESLEAKFLSAMILRGQDTDIQRQRFIKKRQNVPTPYIQEGIATFP